MASAILTSHLASALTRFATHEESIRSQMKAVRKREEDLEDLRRKKRVIVREAEGSERKLSRMNTDVSFDIVANVANVHQSL